VPFILQITSLTLSVTIPQSRILTFFAYLTTLNLNNSVRPLMDGGNNLVEIVLFFLIFLDTRKSIQKENPPPFAQLSNLLSNISFMSIKVQICAVYLTAGLCKAIGEMWQNGTALFYILQNENFSHPLVKEFALEYPEFTILPTYFTIIFQLLFSIFVWNRKTYWYILFFGLFLHLQIAFFMGLFLFGTAMCIMYIAFLPNDSSIRLLSTIKKSPSIYVAFDQGCRICMTFSRFIKNLDIFDKIIIGSAEAPEHPTLRDVPLSKRLETMHAICLETGEKFNGFDAIQIIFNQLILAFPLWPFTFILKITYLGELIYNYISKSRFRHECRDGKCTFDHNREK
jgi:predicted DCC family thiol-disulfide oxidoreductase YuxK